MNEERPRYFSMAIVTMVLLAIGIGVIWITKQLLGLGGDAVYISLILIPPLVYLALTGKIHQMSIFGATASFIDQRTKEIQKGVAEIGEYGPERSVYLGKLKQVMDKDGINFALIYADVDKLRSVTRKLYAEEREKARTNPGIRRRSDRELRESIIEELEFALSDAFFDVSTGGSKQDIFRLEEPDVAMIVRPLKLSQAKSMAEMALESFKRSGYSATMYVLSLTSIGKKQAEPRELDQWAADGLKRSKDRGAEGNVHAPA